MKMTLIGNDGGNNSAGAEVDQLTLDIEWLDGVTLYYRWWMYIDADFSWGTGTAKSKSSRTGGVTCARGYTGYIRKTGFQIDECEDVGTPCGGGCPANGVTISYDFTQQSDSAWHEYIVSVLPNTGTATSNAVFKAWVDGDYIGQQTGFLLHNEDNNTMKEFWLGWMGSSYWQLNGTVDDGGVIYIDDVSVDDVWNSTTYEQGT